MAWTVTPTSSAFPAPEADAVAEHVRAAVRARLFDLPAPRRRLGRFELRRLLGEGGMGVVFEAHDLGVGRDVAIKLLHARHSETGAERLLREARALARLTHPHVVTVYEAGTVDEQVYLVMELVRGRDLSHWLDDRPRGWREIVRLLVQAARGLAAAHAAGLVHRDLKPANVLVTADETAKVADFGLARSAMMTHESPDPGLCMDQLESLTRTGAIVGTPAYLPPEVLDGAQADEHADQFSFCVAAFEAVYGVRPFGGASLATLGASIRAGRVATHGPRTAPRALRRILLRGLRARPDVRWPSMDALADALAATLGPARTRSLVMGGALVASVGTSLALLPEPATTHAVASTPLDVPRAEPEDGRPPSAAALALREAAEQDFAARRLEALARHLEWIAPEPSLPDDPTLAAELLLWRGKVAPDAERAATLFRRAHALAQDADVPSVAARAAGAMAGNMLGAHAEGVDEWVRLAWAASERVPWDRKALVEIVTTAAQSSAQTWELAGSDANARAMLEFADAVVGEVEPDDDEVVAMDLLRLANGWGYVGDHERKLHWSLRARLLLAAVAGPEHPLWPDISRAIGHALHSGEQYQHCEDALGELDDALTGYVRRGDEDRAALLWIEIGACSWRLGRLELALAYNRQALGHFAVHPPTYVKDEQTAHLLSGYVLAELGRPVEARAEYERVLALVDVDASNEVNRSLAMRSLERLPPSRGRSQGT